MRRTRDQGLMARLRAHQLIVGLVILGFGLLLTVIAFESSNGVPFLPSYVVKTTLPIGAPNIAVGTDVRIAGLFEGSVASVSRAHDGGQLLALGLRTSPIGRDAQVAVRLQSLAGQYILSLSRGNYAHDPLPSGGTIPTANDSYLESISTVIAGFSKATLNDLGQSVQLAGEGVLGRGAQLNQAFAGLGETLRQTTALLTAISPGHDLTQLTRGAGLLAGALQGEGSQDAGGLVTSTAKLLGVLSDPTSRVGTTIDELPSFEDQALTTLPVLDPLLSHVTVLSHQLQPAVRALTRSLPSLTALLHSGAIIHQVVPPLVRVGVPALRLLGPALTDLAPDAVLLSDGLPYLGTLTTYMSRFPREIEDGLAVYYIGVLYRPQVGVAKGAPTAVAMVTLSPCAPGYNPNPTPGSVFTDRTSQPCL